MNNRKLMTSLFCFGFLCGFWLAEFFLVRPAQANTQHAIEVIHKYQSLCEGLLK